jgi:hypothetical protein
MPIWKQYGQSDADEGKNQKWLNALTSGRLHHCMMWFSVDRQLWPSVKYGLCCSMATLSDLESVLLLFYGKMLPLGGIVWTASKGIRQLDRGFYGAGLPHPGRGNSGAVKQTGYALRLLHCLWHQTPNIPQTPTCRIGDVIPTPPIIAHQLRKHGYHQLAKTGMREARQI